jgi:two-component system sensor histidine kinase GlrK
MFREMKLTLFSRLVIGYLAVFVLLMAVSFYAIFQMRHLNEVTRSVLESDQRLGEIEKKLADSLLSQVRYEKKFIITKDKALYGQYALFKKDFELALEEADSIASARAKAMLGNVKENYRRYQDLVQSEIRSLNARRDYPSPRTEREKEKSVDGIMAELEKLKAYSQQASYGKVQSLAESGAHARRVVMIITGASLLLVVAISFLITRSIKGPLSTLKIKTGQIARGEFEADLRLSSPPEIAELARALNLMCEKLKDLDRIKSEFFSTMSHELRTPLASIKEGIGLLLEGIGGEITEKQRKLLAILAEESERLIRLVNSLLDLSKMEAGMMTYHREPASLASLIKRAMTEIGPLVEAKRIKFEAQVGEPLPLVKLDGERILQALRNLIGNAVKFTPEGGRVTVSARPRNGGVEVSVSDTGPGIPEESLGAIFDKFKQAASKDSFRLKGTGLGLAIVKHIIDSHEGQVWAESATGVGSTFTFVLP